MLETMNKLMLAGIGAIEMTREMAEQILDDLAKRGQAAGAGRSAAVQDLMDSAQARRNEFREFISRQVRDAIGRLNLASRDDIARLESKLDKLLDQKAANRAQPVDQTMI